MIRAKKVYVRTSKADEDRLFACNRESARVWNECLQLAKNCYLKYQKWISKSELQKQTKGKFHLHSQSIQAVCHKYLFARDSAHQTIKKGHTTTRYPYKKKNHYNTKWAKDGFKIDPTGKIELSMGNHNGKREKPIVVYASNLPQGTIKEIELCYDNGLYLAVSFEDGQKNKEYQSGQAVGVDLGEIHTLAAFCEKGQALIVTGRKIRSLHRLRNKKLAEIQRLQSKCKKGSRQWKKYGRAKQYVLSKSGKQLQDALHKATHNFVEWCIKQSVSDVYIGNPEGVQRNTRKKKKTNRKQAQKLSNWSFGQVKEYLKYKVAQEGINMHEVNEAYTSQTCPVCKKKKKVSSRNYACACGYQEHRDVHGARNILSKAVHGDIRHFDVPTKQKYLRIA
ncbi:putative transposase [Aneurinibacillus soli]|uniref:Putative transposase n=1 Tax=Aneurinibacillus soli TaxID=1500254 RepID=A0A0U5BJQ8_9BACL|nr:RNA-guided endonuclease TnpB family protein [Aneurinibacillus soli]PYE61712.1 putative transposase [Aneurinibacillus soli]BAU28430.1 putative transposase [Aneurinibacillus soli]